MLSGAKHDIAFLKDKSIQLEFLPEFTINFENLCNVITSMIRCTLFLEHDHRTTAKNKHQHTEQPDMIYSSTLFSYLNIFISKSSVVVVFCF